MTAVARFHWVITPMPGGNSVEVLMKARVILIFLSVVFIFNFAVQLLAQTSSPITVTRSNTLKDVTVVSAQEGNAQIKLQCNNNMPFCLPLPAGEYVIVRLPKNRGFYDCVDVRVYRTSADVDSGNNIGEYCIVD
jgi:spore coat protein U-like protein